MRVPPWIPVAAALAVVAIVVFFLAPAMDRLAVPAASPGASAQPEQDPSGRAPAAPAEPEQAVRSAAKAPAEPAVERVTASAGGEAVAGRLFLADGPLAEVVELRLGAGDDPASWKVLHEAFSTPDGTFRFEAVPAGWRGEVLLPQHYRLAQPAATLWRDRAFPASAGTLDLAIEVVRLPSVRGRVLATDGTPAAERTLIVEMHTESGSSIRTASTEDDGRFVLALPPDPLQMLVVACRTDGAQSVRSAWTSLELPAADLRGDIHVGDLQLALGATARVLVLDPDGAPFQGASVIETGASGGRTFSTGEDGTVLVQLVDGVEGLEVQADGYSLVELPRPAPGEGVVVQLRSAARLQIDVVDVEGQPWPHGRLRLKSAKPPFEGGREGRVSSPRGVSAAACNESGVDREGYYTVCRTDEQGRIEWQGLEPGRRLELTLEDALGTVAAHASVPGLAAGERRSVRLQLAREPLRLIGRCVDPAGIGIPGADVGVSVPRAGGVELETDPTGAFESPPLLAERVNVRARAGGFADRSLDDVALPAEIAMELESGRDLVVVLRDSVGAPMGLGTLVAIEGATRWSPIRRARSARDSTAPDPSSGHEFRNVPKVGLALEHVWHRRTNATVVPDGAESFAWTLPRVGRLEVEVAACTFGEQESAHLLLEALDGRGVVQQELLTSGAAEAFRFTPWPGRYRLRRVVQAFDVDADGWRTPAGSRELGLPVEVEVAADRIAHAELEGAP